MRRILCYTLILDLTILETSSCKLELKGERCLGEKSRGKASSPSQQGSDTTVSFLFEQDKITIQLPTGNPFTFPVRFPINEISYLQVETPPAQVHHTEM
ncbi:unnamed protein product, partial [Staurois parvus]